MKQTHDVEIVNPDHVIANLTAGGKIDMQIKVEKAAVMWLQTARRGDERKPLHRFDPARRILFAGAPRVRYRKRARVGDSARIWTSGDDIETNGAIEPEEAVALCAARVWSIRLSVFADLQGTPMQAEEAKAPQIRSCCSRLMILN